MNEIVLAHAGGIDEMAIVLFPVVVGAGCWLLTRERGRPDKAPKRLPHRSEQRPVFGPKSESRSPWS